MHSFHCRWPASYNFFWSQGGNSTGGSVKDDEVITAANEAGISMVFTGRHFSTDKFIFTPHNNSIH